MSEPHPASHYRASTERMLTVMRADQVEALAALLAELKAHGYGEVQIVVRDNRVQFFRKIEVHR